MSSKKKAPQGTKAAGTPAAAKEAPGPQDDPANAPREGANAAAAGDQGPGFQDARQQETHVPASERGLPPRPAPLPGRMNEAATAGGVATSIPQTEPGRYAYEPEPNDQEDETFPQGELDDLATEWLKDPANRTGTATDQGRAAYAHARGVLRARRAGQADMKRRQEKKRSASKEELAQQAAQAEKREGVYKALDFVHNPRAYAADPTNAGDQGPKEPIPVDWRKIQDEEGRRAGNLPVVA